MEIMDGKNLSNTIKDDNGERLTIPSLVTNIMLLSSVWFVTIYDVKTSSFGSRVTKLETCFPKSFHFDHGISFTGI